MGAWSNIKAIVTNTVEVVKDCDDIFKPLYRSFIIAFVNISVFVAITCILVSENQDKMLWVLLLIILYLIIFIPVSAYFHAKMRACAVHLTFETLHDRKVKKVI